MMIVFKTPIASCSPCGALIYASIPTLYQDLAKYEAEGRTFNEFPLYSRKIVNTLRELVTHSTGVEWAISSDATSNTAESITEGWLTVDVFAKIAGLSESYAERFRMRKIGERTIEVEAFPVTRAL